MSNNVIEANNMASLNAITKIRTDIIVEGTTAYLKDEHKTLFYHDGEWLENKPASMTLYELNQNVMAHMPVLTQEEILNKESIINNYVSGANHYYLLLCRDINYYTIFTHHDQSVDYETCGKAVLTCASSMGDILSVENDNDNDMIEIWIRTRTEEKENLVMYFFNCDDFMVTFGG
jgi:hypothetical protein